ncbi:MAG: FHA domain-containing protein [Planctomycetaceae bacterium]|nr:FHA domain-containing protein [Planctomycetaceae bacterium]
MFTLRSPDEAVDDSHEEPEEELYPAVVPGLKRVPELDVVRSTLSRFRRACRQKTAFIIKVVSSESGARPQSILWNRPSLIIGKGEDCDLTLPHAEVSRQHAYFQIVDGKIFCADLDSRTGTHWSNGAAQAGWVDPEEPVSVGPFSLMFEPAPQLFDAEQAEDEFVSEDVSIEEGESAGCEFFLDFMNAGQNVRRYRVTRDVTLIGSGDAAKVHLSHPSVSNAHCSIVRTESGLWMVDLHSNDGTIVNGQVEILAPLNSGDEFQVGRFLVAVHYGGTQADSEPTVDVASEVRPLNSERPSATIAASNGMSDFHETPSDVTPASTNLSALNQLAHLTSRTPASNEAPAGQVGGLSEQFVLNIIKELGIMQQQSLQHAQESMKQTVSTLAVTYQERIDALERQHAALRDEFLRLSAAPPSYRSLTDQTGEMMPSPVPWEGADLADPEFSHLPDPDQGSYECSDPEEREAWIRERMKSIESELNKTRRGWGKMLVELLGY